MNRQVLGLCEAALMRESSWRGNLCDQRDGLLVSFGESVSLHA